jgi:hypothetical protein
VIDAAGAIYVIGGNDRTFYKDDVWASTDGGAWAGLCQGVVGRAHWVGTTGGTHEYQGGALGY